MYVSPNIPTTPTNGTVMEDVIIAGSLRYRDPVRRTDPVACARSGAEWKADVPAGLQIRRVHGRRSAGSVRHDLRHRHVEPEPVMPERALKELILIGGEPLGALPGLSLLAPVRDQHWSPSRTRREETYGSCVQQRPRASLRAAETCERPSHEEVPLLPRGDPGEGGPMSGVWHRASPFRVRRQARQPVGSPEKKQWRSEG